MTDTDTTTPVALDRDTLTLVTLSPDYFRTGDQHALMPNGDDQSRTYYATASRGMGEAWAVIVIGPDDPRGAIGWDLASDYGSLGLGSGHRGWNLQRRYLTPVEDSSSSPTTGPVGPGSRVRLVDTDGGLEAMGATGRVASVDITGSEPLARVDWDDGHHSERFVSRFEAIPEEVTRAIRSGDRVRVANPYAPSWDGEGIVVTAREGDATQTVRMETGLEAGQTGGFSRQWLTLMAPEEAVEAPETAPETFTREDVDRMVREAREAAKREADTALEEFKEAANARAVEYAQDNGLCSEFERCMSDIGLLGRDEWREAHQTSYAVRFIVTVDVTADDADDAQSNAYDMLYNDLSYPMDQNITHHDTTASED